MTKLTQKQKEALSLMIGADVAFTGPDGETLAVWVIDSAEAGDGKITLYCHDHQQKRLKYKLSIPYAEPVRSCDTISQPPSPQAHHPGS